MPAPFCICLCRTCPYRHNNQTSLHPCIRTSVHACMHACMHAYILHPCTHEYVHTCKHMRTYIRNYLPACLRAYVLVTYAHTCRLACCIVSSSFTFLSFTRRFSLGHCAAVTCCNYRLQLYPEALNSKLAWQKAFFLFWLDC